MAVENILELQNVKRAFGSKVVLSGVNLTVARGELVALYGPSGSGKSTLLNLVGAIDRPSEGTIRLAGRDVSRMWEMNRTKVRRTQIGFIFQNYPLIAAYSASENIDMSLRLKGVSYWERRRRIKAALEAVGLSDHARRLPDQLSGGQQQRVAIARVLALHPTIILADEPTSGLDTRTGRRVMKIFQGLAEAEGTAFLVVSHDIDLTERFMNRAYDLREGQLALRPPIGTVEEHDALEARRREVEALHARQRDANDAWDSEEPDFLAEVLREETIGFRDPDFLSNLVLDDLPAVIIVTDEPERIEPQDAAQEVSEVSKAGQTQDVIEDVSEGRNEHLVSERTGPVAEEAAPVSDTNIELVEDVVEDPVTPDAPNDEVDNARS